PEYMADFGSETGSPEALPLDQRGPENCSTDRVVKKDNNKEAKK
ncbi:hypothetical protein AVEN_17878-1, partial [Araneus ventricosus]